MKELRVIIAGSRDFDDFSNTCDICTSLDQEEEYEMWEAKD